MEVNINSCNEKDDNDSVSSSSLSSASTITTPLSPKREHKGGKSLHCVNNTEGDINDHSQFQGFSRLRLNTNLQNDHFMDNENIVFDSRKRKSRKRMHSLQDERENADGNPSQEQGFCKSPTTDVNEQELHVQDKEPCDGNHLSIYCVKPGLNDLTLLYNIC